MRTPYRKYLEWLLLLEKDYESIRSIFFEQSLPEQKATVVEKAQEFLTTISLPPGVKRRVVKNKIIEEDFAVLDRFGYGSFARVHSGRASQNTLTTHNKVVVELIGHPVLRVAVECMLIKKLDLEELSALIQQSFGVTLGVTELAYYKNNYFDYKEMTRSDWVAYVESLADSPYTYRMIYTALTKPLEDVKQLVGLPTKKNFSAFLQTVLSTADYKFRQYAIRTGMDNDVQARKWAEVGIKAGERFEKFGEKDAKNFADTVQTEFEYVDMDVPNITTEMLSGISQVTGETEVKGSVTPTPETHPEMFGEHEV